MLSKMPACMSRQHPKRLDNQRVLPLQSSNGGAMTFARTHIPENDGEAPTSIGGNMKTRYIIFTATTLLLLLLRAYVLIVDGGKLKFGNVIEIDSNKDKSTQTDSEKLSEIPKLEQNATTNGSGNAVNASNGASVVIGK